MASGGAETLLSFSVRELHRFGATGRRNLDLLYDDLSSKGLVHTSAVDEISSLYAIFDIALNSGFGCYVYDYVVDVCADRYLSSRDPREAYLLDGECVKQWAKERALKSISDSVSKGLHNRNTMSVYISVDLGKDLARVNSLVTIMQALSLADPQSSTSREAGREGTGDAAALQQAKLLQQCLQVVQWCVHSGEEPSGMEGSGEEPRMHRRRDFGSHASMAAWRELVAARTHRCPFGKKYSQESGTFLQDLQAITGSPSYPFSSLGAALTSLFLSGTADEAALHHKLAFFVYYLLDGGFISSTASFQLAFPTIPPGLVDLWEAQYHLDSAQPTAHDASHASTSSEQPITATDPHLETAVRLLTCTMRSSLPFKVVAALVTLRQPGPALLVQRARAQAPGRPAELEEVATVVSAALQGGLLADAFLQQRIHCSQLQGGRQKRRQHTEALVGELALWATESSLGPGSPPWMSVLLEMPFNQEEEEALVQWLEACSKSQHPAALHLPLYYLQRGRTAEALAAYGGMSAAWSQDCASDVQLRHDWLRSLLAAAAKQLPATQRALVLHDAADMSDAGQPLLQPLGVARDSTTPALHVVQSTSQPTLFLSQPIAADTRSSVEQLTVAAAAGPAARPAAAAATEALPSTPPPRRVRAADEPMADVVKELVYEEPTPRPLQAVGGAAAPPLLFTQAKENANPAPFPSGLLGSRWETTQQHFDEHVLGQRKSNKGAEKGGRLALALPLPTR